MIIDLIRASDDNVRSIALTSGIPGTVSESAERMIGCVSKLRRAFPDLPIGVEPYVDDISQIDGLHEAGADEIKINVETATDGLFRVFCPSLDRGKGSYHTLATPIAAHEVINGLLYSFF